MAVGLVLGFCQLFPAEAWGQASSRTTLVTTSLQKLNLTVGKSTLLQSPSPVKRVSLTSPEIADAMVISPQQIYLIGKGPGITNLTLWGADNKVTAVVDVEVSPNLSQLKETLHKMFPEEKEIKVSAAHDYLTLAGTVSSNVNLSQVLALASPYAPFDEQKKPKIVNLMEVGGVHQVMLEVRVAEVSRSLLKRLGINFSFLSASGNNFGLSLLNNLTSLPGGGFPAAVTNISDKINAIIRFTPGDATWTFFIDALKEEGLLKVMAEPNLITLSGKTANFLAGGEFPVPVPQSGVAGLTITIDYKPFGVGLSFTPTVLSNKKISIQVAPEVSELDFSNAVTIAGFVVPALTTRRVSTVIELSDGQSFAIAGLLKDDVRQIVSKFPLLGEIPVLGALFRSSSFQKNETELIVIVTPHLVKPLDPTKQTLPTDAYIEPDDFEFYLLGNLEGKKKSKPTQGGLEGNFGHRLPK
jgi:pilus assembly protein CpaC